MRKVDKESTAYKMGQWTGFVVMSIIIAVVAMALILVAVAFLREVMEALYG